MPRPPRRSRLLLCLVAASATSAGTAAAQGWSTLPDDRVAYTATYASSGSFYCYGAGFAPGSSCVASGNTLTLGSGSAIMTLTFTGLTQSIAATNVRGPVASFGSLTKAFSGTGPFQFPTPLNSNVLTFGFALRVDEVGPASGSGVKRFGYIVPPGGTTVVPVNCCGDDAGYSDYFSLPTTVAPAPYRYPLVVFDGFSDLTLRADDTPLNVGARVGVIPEPTTIALAGVGLVGVGLAAARRRQTR